MSDDRRYLVSVDLGAGAYGVLEELTKLGKNRSELIRSAVLFYAAAEGWNIKIKALPMKKVEKPKFKVSREERTKLIELYKQINGIPATEPAKPYWPAIYTCLKKLYSEGFSFDEIESALAVAPKDDLVAEKLRQGTRVPINSLLSEKMFARLQAASEKAMQAERKIEIETLASIKAEAIEAIMGTTAMTPQKAEAYDLIQGSTTIADVQKRLGNFMVKEAEAAEKKLRGEE
jgi:Arc/MetJ-type ribon-helix-helix transcriptional regulator